MKRKNLWIKISACTMAAFLATASVAPVSAADTAAFTEDVFSDTAAEEEFGSEAATADNEFTDEVVVVDEAAEVLAAQAGFGTANTELKAGTYKVTVSLKNASDPSKDSMAGSCIAGAATMVIASDGSAKITVNSKTGKVTVKKGVKKGTYTAKIKVSEAAKGNYKAGSKTVTVTVKVK